MTRIILPYALLTATLAFAIPAQAAGTLTRTFVSSAGADTNPCTIAQPCATFATAYAAVAPNGIVAALDPGKYGPLAINTPVTINGNGWSAITGPASGNAIAINVNAGDKVALIGLELDGAGTAHAGVKMLSPGTLTVTDSVIRNFNVEGIDYETNSPDGQIFVSNTTLSEDEIGINLSVTQSSSFGTTKCVLDHLRMVNNSEDGLDVVTAQQNINVTVTDSVIANNNSDGILAMANNGTANVMVRNTTIANNGQVGLNAQGTVASIRITRSTVTTNAHGWLGNVTSYGDNNIDDNSDDNTAPSQVQEK